MSWRDWFSGGGSKERVEPVMNMQSSDPTGWAEGLGWESYGNNATGVPVTPSTALRSGAVFACVRLIAGAIQTLPIPVYARDRQGERERITGNRLEPLLTLRPNPKMSAATFWEAITMDVLLRGNGLGVLRRQSPVSPEVRQIDYIPWSRVAVDDDTGRLRYRFTNDDHQWEVLDQDDVLHFPGLGWTGTKALTPIAYHAQTIGLDLATTEHSALFFGQGTATNLSFEFPNRMTEEQRNEFRDYVMRQNAGRENAWKPLILAEGGKAGNLGLTAEDAQLAEMMGLTPTHVAMLYGVPPFMIGITEKSTSWGTGLEQQSTGFVKFTLMPHLSRFENELNAKLFRQQSNFAEFDTRGLMRGDSTARSNFYNTARGSMTQPGSMTVNEIRRAENLPAIEGGDELMMPVSGEEQTTTDEGELDAA